MFFYHVSIIKVITNYIAIIFNYDITFCICAIIVWLSWIHS